MPLTLKPRRPLPSFTFNLSSPSPPADLAIPLGQNEPIPPRPPADFIAEKDMYMFGTYPLEGDGELGRGVIRCGKCGKVGIEWAAGEHRRICSHILEGTPLTTKKVNNKASGTKTTESSKKRRASEVSNPNLSPKKRTKLSSLPTPNTNDLAEKSNEDDDSQDDELSMSIDLSNYKGLKKSEIKKIQKERMRLERKEAKDKEKVEVAERKRMKGTNPINLDRQCGVINDKSAPCARSLTCKTHTVGAKRSVEGRSRPYDELYLEWQREHNPNFKEPQKREVKDPKDKVASGGGLKKKKKPLHSLKSRGGEEGLDLDDEDGMRELQELIDLTRMGGNRVRVGYITLGLDDKEDDDSLLAPPATTLKLPGTANGRGSISKPPGGLGLGNNKPVLTFQPSWMNTSTSTEFASVGQLLNKALAARPGAGKMTHGHAHGHKNMAGGGKNNFGVTV
ncbi:hypothetical protein I302_108420 [Kwoniella bestiolae CBS 10118]|uniref:SCA7 domain-containing protein n=1 Tax=Kwoniella bestiolae CBS 10118 TaxID=1296100 RepID=A0A1B9FVS9_9TREE|nr:hypothetical protein I302_07205 [Kwoniella bestiolae CBS 10118]OCF22860.1 hypothetical protein I302_07205 [Kwoniella bestiolae CBS 10118]